MSRRKIRTADDARACLAAAEASGLTRAAWARAHGIDARSLNAWRLNLARGAGKTPTTSQTALRIVELVPERGRPAYYRVSCGDLTLDVPTDFDDVVVTRLLGAMLAC